MLDGRIAGSFGIFPLTKGRSCCKIGTITSIQRCNLCPKSGDDSCFCRKWSKRRKTRLLGFVMLCFCWVSFAVNALKLGVGWRNQSPSRYQPVWVPFWHEFRGWNSPYFSVRRKSSSIYIGLSSILVRDCADPSPLRFKIDSDANPTSLAWVERNENEYLSITGGGGI